MSSAKLACSYYLLGISIFAIGFSGILMALEWTESEYLRVHFHNSKDSANNGIFNILVTILVYSGIVILLWGYITKT